MYSTLAEAAQVIKYQGLHVEPAAVAREAVFSR